MTEAEVIQTVRRNLEELFPKVCQTCQRNYATLREFILVAEPLDPVTSFDVELGNWNPSEPIGTLAMANCPCGSTLAVSTRNLPVSEYWQVLEWIRMEMARRGVSQAELLGCLRDEIRKQVLAEPAPGDT
jgi:hypothetical protein